MTVMVLSGVLRMNAFGARASAAAAGLTHDRAARPSIWTVQAPHWATPHPYLVPVRCSSSRSTHSRGMSSAALTVRSVPLIRIVAMALSLSGTARRRARLADASAAYRPLPGDEDRTHPKAAPHPR